MTVIKLIALGAGMGLGMVGFDQALVRWAPAPPPSPGAEADRPAVIPVAGHEPDQSPATPVPARAAGWPEVPLVGVVPAPESTFIRADFLGAGEFPGVPEPRADKNTTSDADGPAHPRRPLRIALSRTEDAQGRACRPVRVRRGDAEFKALDPKEFVRLRDMLSDARGL